MAAPSEIEAKITGDVSGQVAVGQHILQVHAETGATVNVAAEGETPRPQRRRLPVDLRGRRDADLIGRDREVRIALDALGAGIPLEFVGKPGLGKTALLKHMAYNAPEGAAVDGVVYHDAHGEPVEDTLDRLYEAFYEKPARYKPEEAELRHALKDIRALVVVDELNTDRSGAAQILDALPAASSVFGSARRSLWGGGRRSVQLRGLPRDAAVELLTRELERDLTDREQQTAAVIADAVGGQPMELLRAAALVTQLGCELAELADNLHRGSAPDKLAQLLLATLDPEQQRILEVLAVLDGATLPTDQLAELTGVEEAGPVIASLMRLGLVQSHSPRYSTAGVVEPPTAGIDLAPSNHAARVHMIGWLEARRDDPEAVVQEVQAVLAILRNAARDEEWADLLRIGRAAEGALVLTSRWGAWREVLELELAAARKLGDSAAEGWALHQLGSRALCLGDRAAALAGLTDALRIREELDDARGAEVTQHNLDLLMRDGHKRPPAGRLPPAIGWRTGANWIPRVTFPFIVLLAILGPVALLLLPTISPPPVPPAFRLNVQPTSIDFGNQLVGTSSLPRTVTVSNDNAFDVTVKTVSVGGDASSSYKATRDGCTGIRLGPGRSCPVAMLFEPGRVGPHEASLTFAVKDQIEQPVRLRGVGTSPAPSPSLRLEPPTVDFGNVVLPSSSTRRVTVTNVGGKQLPLGAISITGADGEAFFVSRADCPPDLEPGSQCAVDVTFSPGALGPHAAALSVSEADTGKTKESSLTGRGIDGPPPQPRSIDLRVPASQTLPYGTVYEAMATATVTPAATPTLHAVGLPQGVTFVDNRNGTGVFRGTILSPVGKVPVTVTAASGSDQVVQRFELRIVPADVSLRWNQPVLQLTPGSVLSAEAILTQVSGTRGDPTQASVRVDVHPCGPSNRGPTPVNASGRAVTTIQGLPLGLHTAQVSLVNSPNYRLASSQPLKVLVVPNLLLVNGSLLSDLLPQPGTGLCLPIGGA